MIERTKPAPPKETGFAEGPTPAKTFSTSVQHPTTKGVGSASPVVVVTPLPLRWAKTLIDGAAGPVPEYGSPEWAALPDDAREKVAGCVLAAEQWRTRYHRERLVDVRPRTRRAREIAEARRPRPGDYMGGPVQWDEAASE